MYHISEISQKLCAIFSTIFLSWSFQWRYCGVNQNFQRSLSKHRRNQNKRTVTTLKERNGDHCQLAEIGWRAQPKFLLSFVQLVWIIFLDQPFWLKNSQDNETNEDLQLPAGGAQEQYYYQPLNIWYGGEWLHLFIYLLTSFDSIYIVAVQQTFLLKTIT